MDKQNENSLFELVIDTEAQDYLIEIAKWARLISIMGLIAGLLIAFAGLVTIFLGSSFSQLMMRGLGPVIGVLSMLFGLIYLYPSWQLLKYATTMPSAIKKNDQLLVNKCFKNLKSVFRFWGILALVILGFYALAFVAQMFASALT